MFPQQTASNTAAASSGSRAFLKIATTRWCCCCANRTAAFILVSAILLSDIIVGIESWLVTFGVWTPKTIVRTTKAETTIVYHHENTTETVVTHAEPTLIIRSVHSWYVLDALYCTFDAAIVLIGLYALLRYRPKLLRPLVLLEFAWLVFMFLLLVVGLIAFITSSITMSSFFTRAVSWMFTANAEPMFEKEADGEYHSLPIGSVLISIIVQGWILAILAGAVHELRMTIEQRRNVAGGDDAAGIQYNRMTDGASSGGGGDDSTQLQQIRSTTDGGKPTPNGTTGRPTINGVGNFWDVEANPNHRGGGSNEFDVMSDGRQQQHHSSVVVEFDEPFEPHSNGNGVTGTGANGALKV